MVSKKCRAFPPPTASAALRQPEGRPLKPRDWQRGEKPIILQITGTARVSRSQGREQLVSPIWTSVRPLTQYPATYFSSNWKGKDLMGGLIDEELAAG